MVAGGGSFVTLSLMIFMGLPPTTANGSNRVAILAQNVWAVRRFHGRGAVDWALGARAALPAIAGAALGTGLALAVGEEAFRRVLALLMVAMAVVTLLRPGTPPESGEVRPRGPWFGLGFFAVGFYGGFVQAGVGFLLMLVLHQLLGLDLVRTNMHKVVVVLVFSLPALAVFVLTGNVAWTTAGALAAGNVVGAVAATRLAVRGGDRPIRIVVGIALLLMALRLVWPG